jgi:hypothetical protein
MSLRPGVILPKDMNARQWEEYCRQNLSADSINSDQIADGSVTIAKLSFTVTSAGLSLLDDANAAAQRVTLGLGTAAVQNTGTSGANVPLLNAANTHASAKCTLFGIGSASPAGTQAANADTSGATLGQLETEVNEVKAVLRTFGLIA